MKYDFDWFEINQRMDTISLEAARASAYVYSNMVMTESGFNYIILTNEVRREFRSWRIWYRIYRAIARKD